MPRSSHPYHYKYFFVMARLPQVGKGLLICEVSRSHSDTLRSVRLLWTSEQPNSQTSTWQHTTLTTVKHSYIGGIRTRNPNKRATSDPHPRPPGQWDCLLQWYKSNYCHWGDVQLNLLMPVTVQWVGVYSVCQSTLLKINSLCCTQDKIQNMTSERRIPIVGVFRP
jgi:hypothetical protein